MVVGEISQAQKVTRAPAQTIPEVMPQPAGSAMPPLSEEPGAAAATTMGQEAAPPLAPEPPVS